MSTEEKEFIQLEKFINPITGQKGQKVASKRRRDVWIALKQALNEVIES